MFLSTQSMPAWSASPAALRSQNVTLSGKMRTASVEETKDVTLICTAQRVKQSDAHALTLWHSCRGMRRSGLARGDMLRARPAIEDDGSGVTLVATRPQLMLIWWQKPWQPGWQQGASHQLASSSVVDPCSRTTRQDTDPAAVPCGGRRRSASVIVGADTSADTVARQPTTGS